MLQQPIINSPEANEKSESLKNELEVIKKNQIEIKKLKCGQADSLEKTDAGRDWGQEEKGTTEDEMARQHH